MINKLLYDFNSFEKLNNIMNELGIYSSMAEEAFLLFILSSIFTKKELI